MGRSTDKFSRILFVRETKSSETNSLLRFTTTISGAVIAGRTGHPLDTEHVAVLVSGTQSEPLSSWKAVYWFAAADQDTLCDTSTAERAASLDAEERGPRVWISQGRRALVF